MISHAAVVTPKAPMSGAAVRSTGASAPSALIFNGTSGISKSSRGSSLWPSATTLIRPENSSAVCRLAVRRRRNCNGSARSPGFDLASGEQQDDLVGDGRAEPLGHRGVVGFGGWWAMATASNPVRPQLSRAQGFLVK